MVEPYYWVEGPWTGRLGIVGRPRGGEWLEDEVRGWAQFGLNLVVSLLTSDETMEFDLADEENLCRSNGIEFVSLPIPDRGVPSSRRDVLKLVRKLDAQMTEGKTIGVHCRQGIGRSGLIAACLLVSSGLSPEVAFARLTEARGRPVPETSEQRRWVEGLAPELAEASARQSS